jgi:hypothetical protein
MARAPAQPSHYIHAVILGSKERQSLIEKDIRLPFGLPALAHKYAPCWVSRLQAVNERFQAQHYFPRKIRDV